MTVYRHGKMAVPPHQFRGLSPRLVMICTPGHLENMGDTPTMLRRSFTYNGAQCKPPSAEK